MRPKSLGYVDAYEKRRTYFLGLQARRVAEALELRADQDCILAGFHSVCDPGLLETALCPTQNRLLYSLIRGSSRLVAGMLRSLSGYGSTGSHQARTYEDPACSAWGTALLGFQTRSR